ncbi:KH domain-containing protein [Lachnospiraceae bacterium 46-61]
MKDLLEVIAKNLVDYPEKVSVKEISEEHSLILELYVSPEDMGKVIGKQGRIAKAIRTVVKACATHEDKRVIIEIKQP